MSTEMPAKMGDQGHGWNNCQVEITIIRDD